MTDNQNPAALIEEAATILQSDVNTKFPTGWADTYRRAAENQRDFWASHAEPEETDTATALLQSASHYDAKPNDARHDYNIQAANGSGFFDIRPIEIAVMLRDEAKLVQDVLEREKRENARAQEIGRAVKTCRELYASDAELGHFILEQMKANPA